MADSLPLHIASAFDRQTTLIFDEYFQTPAEEKGVRHSSRGGLNAIKTTLG